MLPEINLLPERYKRDVTPLFIAVLSLVLILVTTLLFLMYYANLENERTAAVNEAAELQLVKVELEAESGILGQNLSPEQQLQEAIQQLEAYKIQTSEFSAELIQLLPERGFFISFFYQRDGLLEMTVSFDEMQEAAQYYDALYQNPYVDAVRMSDIGTEAIAEEEEEEDSDQPQTTDTMLVKPRYEATYELALDLEQPELEDGETP